MFAHHLQKIEPHHPPLLSRWSCWIPLLEQYQHLAVQSTIRKLKTLQLSFLLNAVLKKDLYSYFQTSYISNGQMPYMDHYRKTTFSEPLFDSNIKRVCGKLTLSFLHNNCIRGPDQILT